MPQQIKHCLFLVQPLNETIVYTRAVYSRSGLNIYIYNTSFNLIIYLTNILYSIYTSIRSCLYGAE